jgi:hypothetical protein
MEKDNLKKALHKAIAKAYKNGQQTKGHHAVAHIVRDIQDPNNVPQVPHKDLPATSQGVLNKDVTLSEMHQQKQANAMAKLGQPPSMKAPKMPKPLTKFMQNREEKKMSKAKVDQGKTPDQKRDARWDRAGSGQEGVHNPPFKSAPGMSTSGFEIDQTGKTTPVARNSHEKVLGDLKTMKNPKIPG